MKPHESTRAGGARVSVALAALAIAFSCARAEDSPLVDRGGNDDAGGGSGALGGTSGSAGSSGSGNGGSNGGAVATGGTSGRGGSASGGSTSRGGASSSGGSNGDGGADGTVHGCLDDGAGGEGGQGGASGGAPGEGGANGGPRTLFSDDFEDGDDDGWESSSGEWDVADSGDDENLTQVYEQSQSDGSALRIANVVGLCLGDQIVEARVKVLDFTGSSTSYMARIFARYLDEDTHYSLGFTTGNNGELFIGKQVPGRGLEKLDASNDFDGDFPEEDVWYTFRLEVVGSSLRAYLNDELALEANDEQITSGGAALGTNKATAMFDDVRVMEP